MMHNWICDCGRKLYGRHTNFCQNCGRKQKGTMDPKIKKALTNIREKVSVEETYDDTAHEDLMDAREDDAMIYMACTCDCQACEGTGFYQFGRSYKKCCMPCPAHYPNNE